MAAAAVIPIVIAVAPLIRDLVELIVAACQENEPTDDQLDTMMEQVDRKRDEVKARIAEIRQARRLALESERV
jgi:hypothetical protein